jgi:hypothetical protein
MFWWYVANNFKSINCLSCLVLIVYFLIRHLRFLLCSSDSILNTPADPASLCNKDTAKECRMDAMETDQSETKRLALMNSAKIEELADGELNES